MDKHISPEDDPCFIPPFLRKTDLPDEAFKAPEAVDESQPGILHPTLGKPSALWPYTDKTGNAVCYICRFDLSANGGGRKKEYRPYTRAGDKWAWKGVAEPRPLYNLHRLVTLRDAPVLIVEGEKAADALKDILPDYVTTTAMHGAQSPRKTDWSPLKDRDAIIWPELDDAGFGFLEKSVLSPK